MPRTPSEHAMWFVCIGVVVGVLASTFKYPIVSFWSIWGVQEHVCEFVAENAKRSAALDAKDPQSSSMVVCAPRSLIRL